MDKVIKNNRESNIELLRIALMFMIIMHHLIMHGTLMSQVAFIKSDISDSKIIRILLNSFLICAVNCFVFITGYYGIRFKISGLIKLLFQMLFYSVVISSIFFILEPNKINLKNLYTAFFPLNVWWFLGAYVILYIFAPFINKLYANLEEKEQRYLVVLVGIVVMFLGFSDSLPNIITVSRGYSFVNFIFLYILGRYIFFYNKKLNLKKSIIGYFFSCAIMSILVLTIWNYKSSVGAWKIYNYNDILVVISAVCLFFIFKNIKVNSKIINWISKSVLGIYMIHDHYLIRDTIYKNIFKIKEYLETPIFLIALIGMAAAIFLICLVLDKIREYIMKPIENYILELNLIKRLNEKLEF